MDGKDVWRLKYVMWIFKYILSLLHVFYIGILAAFFLILGLLSPVFYTLAGWTFAGWLVYGLVEQIIFARVMKDNPELQEIVNSVMANTAPFGTVSEGEEITLCKMEELQLAGRCLSKENDRWNIRLLYEGSYQMFDWKLVYHEQFLPQMLAAEGENIPDRSLWVKCYQKDEDGVARWNLHLLWRDGTIYKDIPFDHLSYIRKLEESYDMEYKENRDVLALVRKVEDEALAERMEIPWAGREEKPRRICFGGIVMFGLEDCTVSFSVGAEYGDMSVGQMGNCYAVGTYIGKRDGIYCSGLQLIDRDI